MRHQVLIESPNETRGANGEVLSSTWATFATVKAEVIPMQGRESYLANQPLAENVVQIRTRYISGITPKMRVSYDSRYFDIESVINVEEKNREIKLLTREVK